MDIKRIVLWVVLVFSMVMMWDSWQKSNGHPSIFSFEPQPVATTKTVTPGSADANAAAGIAVPSVGASASATAASGTTASASAVPAATASAVQGQIVTVTTDVIKADIDTLGGEVKRLELLTQRDTVDPTKNLVLFDSSASRTYLAQTGLIGGDYPTHKTLFTADAGDHVLDATGHATLVLTAEQNGVKLVKTFTFTHGSYDISVKHAVTNEGAAPINPSLYLQLVRDGTDPAGQQRFVHTFTGAAVYTETNKFQKFTFEKIGENKADHAKQANDGWFAIIQHYFVSAFIPPVGLEREYFSKPLGNNLFAIGAVLPLGTIAPGATVTNVAQLYSGPEDSAVLEKTAPGLDLVKDYGYLTIIAKPIFWLMTAIHKVIGNWGFTIIVLTIMIKLLFFPLSAASYRSMARMKLVAPKITSIRERLKGDPAAMNKEMMQLYKVEKINPLGGCLPMVVQIPVFISLYWVLLASVEIRNAPWIGWIHDLAAPDPWHILPVVMAISMFVQTKLNPKPPDPMQAKVMMFMPLVFSVMFFFFPAGLVLYWIVNNILSILQQWFISKKMNAPKV